MTIDEDEILVSFDVRSLYTSIPIDETLDIIAARLSIDDQLSNQTPLSPENMRTLLSICLKTTNFKFRNAFYELMDGVRVAMGSPASSPVANLFVEHLEKRALETAPCKPKIWKRFVDDIFAIIRKQNHDEFLAHLNNQHCSIQFASGQEKKGRFPFLDASPSWTLWYAGNWIGFKVYRNQHTKIDTYHSIPTIHRPQRKALSVPSFTVQTKFPHRVTGNATRSPK